jgi:YggT family protein
MILLLITAIRYFCNFLYALIFIRVILSWFPMAHGSAPVRLLFSITEPILAPIRSVIKKSPLGGPGMMLDFSPIIAYFLIVLAQQVVISLLMQFV